MAHTLMQNAEEVHVAHRYQHCGSVSAIEQLHNDLLSVHCLFMCYTFGMKKPLVALQVCRRGCDEDNNMGWCTQCKLALRS